MAKEIGIDVKVDGVDKSINSLKDLKQAIKEATNEQIKAAEQFGVGSKEYEKASKNVSALKDKVDDLKDSTKSLQGSGIERASQGFNQLGEGLRNLDFDKVKVGLVAMKSALAAVGIGLIVQAVAYLVENFDSLSQGSGVLAKALRFVGDVVSGAIDLFTEFTDLLGLTNSELDKQGDAIKTNADKAKEAIASQTAEYDRQIAIAKASGKSAVDLEIAKQQAIIETNKALVEQTIAYVRQGGVLTEEQNKLLTEQLNGIKNAVTTQEVIQLNAEKERDDNYKKHLEENTKKDKDYKDNALKKIQAFDKWKSEQLAEELRQKELKLQTENALEKTYLDEQKRSQIAEAELAVLQNEGDFNALVARLDLKRQIELDNENLTESEKALIRQKYADEYNKLKETEAEKNRKIETQKRDATFEIAQQGINGLQALSDLYFIFKTKNLEKGSAEELKQAKKQFDINKGLQIASATIAGIQGVINALTAPSVIPEPFGSILKAVTAVTIGATAAANIAKISSTKFNPGGGGSTTSASISAPSSPNISIPSAPTISNPSNTASSNIDPETGENKSFNPTITVKAQVYEGELTNLQNEKKEIKKQNTF